MSQTVPVSVVVMIAAAAGVIWLLYRCVTAISSSVKELRGSNAASIKALTELTQEVKTARALVEPLMGELHGCLASVPKLLESVARVGHAQLEVVQQQREEQAARARNPFGRPNAPVAGRDVEAANLEHEVQQIMRSEGISREEALLRMNPANTRSVWDGDELMSGWR